MIKIENVNQIIKENIEMYNANQKITLASDVFKATSKSLHTTLETLKSVARDFDPKAFKEDLKLLSLKVTGAINYLQENASTSMTDLSVKTIVEKSVHNLKQLASSKKVKVELVNDKREKIPELIFMNKSLMEVSLTNLLENAILYNHSGKVRV